MKKSKYDFVREIARDKDDDEDYFSVTFAGATDGKGQVRCVLTANEERLTLHAIKFGGKIITKNIAYTAHIPYDTITLMRIKKSLIFRHYNIRLRFNNNVDGISRNSRLQLIVPNGLIDSIRMKDQKEDIQKLIDFLRQRFPD